MNDSITDVNGLLVGHAQNREAGTGCTVLIVEKGAIAGVDVRGGAPGTRETDLLDPVNMVQKIHGIYLSGGSAFGLEGAGGVMHFLEERGIGFEAGPVKVPIVTGAVIFDLNIGNPSIRPDYQMGYQACLNASNNRVAEGSIGAGTGATVGKYYGISNCMKGGIGSASIVSGNLVVGALAVVNSFGDIVNPESGKIIAGTLDDKKEQFVDTNRLLTDNILPRGNPFIQNTTLGVVATNARLSKAEAKRLSMSAHDGFARCISPSHTIYDGDTVFSLAIGEVEANFNQLNALAAQVMAISVQRAILKASSLHGIISYRDLRKENKI